MKSYSPILGFWLSLSLLNVLSTTATGSAYQQLVPGNRISVDSLMQQFEEHLMSRENELIKASIRQITKEFWELIRSDSVKYSDFEKNMENRLSDKGQNRFKNYDEHHSNLLKILWAGRRNPDPEKLLEYIDLTKEFELASTDYIENGKYLRRLGHIFEKHRPVKYAQHFYELALESFGTADSQIKAQTSNDLAILYYNESRFIEAKFYFEQALKVAAEVSDRKTQSRAYSNLGVTLTKLGKFPEALKYHLISLTIKDQLGDMDSKAKSLNSIAILYAKQGLFSEALKYFQESLEIKESLQDSVGIAIGLSNIGGSYSELGDYVNALIYQKRALAIKKIISDEYAQASTMSDLGDTYVRLDSVDLGFLHMNEALQIRRKVGNPHAIAMSLLKLGSSNLDIGDFTLARTYINEAIDVFLQLETPLELAESYLILGKIEFEEANFDLSERYFDEALGISDRLNARRLTLEITQNQSQLYRKLGDFEKSLDAQIKYHAIEDSIFSNKNSLQIARLETDAVLKAKDVEISLLEAREAKEVAYRVLWACLAILALVLCLVVYFLLYKRIKQSHKSTETLKEQSDEIKSINSTLEKKMSERNKLLQEQNKKLKKYIYFNSHIVRAPVSRILALINLYRADKSNSEDINFISKNVYNSAKELDETLREINKTLEKEGMV
ncbi:MAG: tetratricopeptide repeat protein [Reichenbachiella sp.]|uniref:tetratricopeptide repeat protein n=1 Tax=Reichenbachiella sp. TaxID=2184521 RepID=UPI003265BF60